MYKEIMKTKPAFARSPLENYLPRLLALALLAALLLCLQARGQDTNAPVAKPAGVYALVSVDGKTVPCTIQHGQQAMLIESGSFTITTNRQCLSRMIITVGKQTNIVCDTKATYTLKGDSLDMLWQNGGRTQGVVAGNTFTMGNEGMTFVYRK